MNDMPGIVPSLNDAERLDRLRLIRSENVGPVTFRQLLGHFGSAQAALSALPDLARRGGRKRVIRTCPPAEAEREWKAVRRSGGRMIMLGDPEYPTPLAMLGDAPGVLSVLGDPGLLSRPTVALVGARNGSANGVRIARDMARSLGASGICISSGLARGIDAAAHQGALATGTVAVMAGGVDVIYPRDNSALYDSICRQGAVVSEQPFGLRPQARHFPTRNRIICGLATATVVIEATLRSGSLITARLAGEQGREVMAVPGTPLDPRARGTNRLIREGALLVESADDVLEGLGDALRFPVSEPAARAYQPDAPALAASLENGLESARTALIQALGAAPAPLDDVLRTSGVTGPQASLILLELELAGRLQRHAGGQVSLAFEI